MTSPLKPQSQRMRAGNGTSAGFASTTSDASDQNTIQRASDNRLREYVKNKTPPSTRYDPRIDDE